MFSVLIVSAMASRNRGKELSPWKGVRNAGRSSAGMGRCRKQRNGATRRTTLGNQEAAAADQLAVGVHAPDGEDVLRTEVRKRANKH